MSKASRVCTYCGGKFAYDNDDPIEHKEPQYFGGHKHLQMHERCAVKYLLERVERLDEEKQDWPEQD